MSQATPGAAPEARRVPRATIGRVIVLAITAVSLYVVAPSISEVLSAWPELVEINAIWLVVVVGFEAASFSCLWWLYRISLRYDRWVPIITSQLASNAFSRIVPGGAASGGALQYRMLTQAGAPAASVATGITVVSLLTTATVLALPLLTLPATSGGPNVDTALSTIAWVGGGVFVATTVLASVILFSDRPLRAIGASAQWLRNRLRPRHEPRTDLGDRLIAERNLIRSHLQAQWWKAAIASVGKWGFDYAALLAAVYAVDERPDPFLVLLAFAAAAVLGMIPLTPGGVGFVEAGLTATLTVVGVQAGNAVLAVLVYRLASYWLPMPAGLLAYGWFGLWQRRQEPAAEAAPA